eukprot:TRINITY_DN76451_c0_g1_i1.p2 TRINITY_DN76451_c0_g1~~TRINITY_DN76451_c0_g1_i1.p2  ORF type:complete len:131 (+),score=1.59 TRINITY_DN76451_c0_g1_i1:65-457(+)
MMLSWRSAIAFTLASYPAGVGASYLLPPCDDQVIARNTDCLAKPKQACAAPCGWCILAKVAPSGQCFTINTTNEVCSYPKVNSTTYVLWNGVCPTILVGSAAGHAIPSGGLIRVLCGAIFTAVLAMEVTW